MSHDEMRKSIEFSNSGMPSVFEGQDGEAPGDRRLPVC